MMVFNKTEIKKITTSDMKSVIKSLESTKTTLTKASLPSGFSYEADLKKIETEIQTNVIDIITDAQKDLTKVIEEMELAEKQNKSVANSLTSTKASKLTGAIKTVNVPTVKGINSNYDQPVFSKLILPDTYVPTETNIEPMHYVAELQDEFSGKTEDGTQVTIPKGTKILVVRKDSGTAGKSICVIENGENAGKVVEIDTNNLHIIQYLTDTTLEYSTETLENYINSLAEKNLIDNTKDEFVWVNSYTQKMYYFKKVDGKWTLSQFDNIKGYENKTSIILDDKDISNEFEGTLPINKNTVEVDGVSEDEMAPINGNKTANTAKTIADTVKNENSNTTTPKDVGTLGTNTTSNSNLTSTNTNTTTSNGTGTAEIGSVSADEVAPINGSTTTVKSDVQTGATQVKNVNSDGIAQKINDIFSSNTSVSDETKEDIKKMTKNVSFIVT